MLEDISKIGCFRFDQSQAQAGKGVHVIVEREFIRFDRMDCLEHTEGKDSANNAGNFQRQLLRWVQAVDAIRDGGLKRIRKSKVLEIHESRIDAALLILNDQNP